jgi:hypothetical protein
LEDAFGDLKDVAERAGMVEVEVTKNAVEDMTVAEKEAEAAKNGVRNEAEEGKRQQCLVVRGRS